MKNENDNPALIPFDDRNPSSDRLYRSPSEMSDEQFALLAAAWADGGLDDESLSEIESIFSDKPEKRIFAEGFMQIRLKPLHETWEGRNNLLRTSPFTITLKRGVLAVLAAAAVIAAFITIRPVMENTFPISPSSSATELQIASAIPLYKMKYIPAFADNIETGDTKITILQDLAESENNSLSIRIKPLPFNDLPETIRIEQQVNPLAITKPDMAPIIVYPAESVSESNWIIRGMLAVANLVSKGNEPVDKYDIAGACIKGVNNALGWEMQLEKILAEDGEPVAVDFSSSLLSFRSPVKKTGEAE